MAYIDVPDEDVARMVEAYDNNPDFVVICGHLEAVVLQALFKLYYDWVEEELLEDDEVEQRLRLFTMEDMGWDCGRDPWVVFPFPIEAATAWLSTYSEHIAHDKPDWWEPALVAYERDISSLNSRCPAGYYKIWMLVHTHECSGDEFVSQVGDIKLPE